MPGHRRRSDDLFQALTAFAHAIPCHRCLARLAGRFFDSTVVNHEARKRAEHHRWIASWEPIFAKISGHELRTTLLGPDADLPPLPPPRTQRAVQRELAGWDFWMTAGRLALARHKQRPPHSPPSLGQLVGLIRIASKFGHLACGLPSATVASQLWSFEAALADLKRTYGTRSLFP